MKYNLQFFAEGNTAAAAVTGVTPVNEITFSVNTAGRDTSVATTKKVVTDAESLSIAIDGNIEEWDAMDAGGWKRRLMTAKSITISMGGKRNYGDPGNDYVAGLFMRKGQECNSIMTVNFPNGDKLEMPCVINVTSLGGDATSAGGLEWEALSDGRPTYTPASQTS